MSQADFSDYVIHFTKDNNPHSGEVHGITGTDARARLIRILDMCRIVSTNMPWTNRPAVCFTECTWPSLLRRATTSSW